MLRNQVCRPIGNRRDSKYDKPNPARAEPKTKKPWWRPESPVSEGPVSWGGLNNGKHLPPPESEMSTRHSLRKPSTPTPSYFPWGRGGRTHGGRSSEAHGTIIADSRDDVFWHRFPEESSSDKPQNSRLAILEFESKDNGTIKTLVHEHVLEKVPEFAEQLQESKANIPEPHPQLIVRSGLAPVDEKIMFQVIEYLTNEYLPAVETENNENSGRRLDDLLELWHIANNLETIDLQEAVEKHMADPKWHVEVYRGFAMRVYDLPYGWSQTHFPSGRIGRIIHDYLSENAEEIIGNGHLPSFLESCEMLKKQMYDMLENKFWEMREQIKVRSRTVSPQTDMTYPVDHW